MKTCRILLVDDDERWHSVANEVVGKHEEFVLVSARSRDDAKQSYKQDYFHIAIVDLHVIVDRATNPVRSDSGIDILNDLYQSRPSCRRILTTENYWLEAFRFDILNAFRPTNVTADRLIIKEDFKDVLEYLIYDYKNRWLRAPIDVIGGEQVVEELKARPGIEWGYDDQSVADNAQSDTIRISVMPCADEIDSLVSRVFGQGSELFKSPERRKGNESPFERQMRERYDYLARPSSEDVASVHLRPLGKGQSSSVVLRAKPRLYNQKDGVDCVVKIGPVNEIREEYRRFCRFVRFRKSSSRRIEMLGYEEADTLGALCLSFAGGADDTQLASFEELFRDELKVGEDGIRELLNPDKQDWYGASSSPKGLCQYWDEAFPWKNRREQPLVFRDWLRGDGKRLGGVMDGYELQIEGVSLGVPENLFASPLFHTEWPTCIVHGDLHGGNILLGEGNHPILIDYRNVGIGPRCMDFAALESSVRLACSRGPETVKDIADWAKRERTILKAVWQNAPIRPNNQILHWQKLSILLGNLAQENFKQSSGTQAVSVEEYGAACLLWIFRVFSNRRFTHVQKRRLAIWGSEIFRYLDQRK